jgi:hypothetical protein
MALSDDDKNWIRDTFTIGVGRRSDVSAGETVTLRSDVWRWSRESVSLNRTLTAELAALRSAVDQLVSAGSIDYSKVEAAAEKAVRDVLGELDA